MKHRSGKFFAVLLVCVLVCMFWVPCTALANAEGDRYFSVTVVNRTSTRVLFALSKNYGYYDSLKGWTSTAPGDYSQGWWNIEPGRKMSIKVDFHGGCVYGYYAMSPDDGRVWAGSEKKGMNAGKFWIHPGRSFRAHPDDPIKGGKKVVFRPLDAYEDKRGNYTIIFTEKQGHANPRLQGSPSTANAAIRGNRVNIRHAPSLQAQVLFQLNNGDAVQATGITLMSDGGEWFQIITPSGKVGWVFGRYISIW